MMSVSRRTFFGVAVAAGAVATTGAGSKTAATVTKAAGLRSIATDAKPISAQEHETRIAKLQSLMQRRKVAALLVEAGSTLEYFTGIRWSRSERTTAALIPATGRVVVVTPYFEAPSIAETLKIQADVRPWKEDESPFELLADALRGMSVAQSPLAVEVTTRFFIIDRIKQAARNVLSIVAGDELVRACRLIKSPAEIALMQVANNVTLAMLKYLHARVDAGMNRSDIADLAIAATEALGGNHEFSSVLLNEASAFPHGSTKPQSVREGSIILIDTGCTVHGYQSDITRTWVFGKPSARQREVWGTVKRGQEIALETARLGTPVGAIDKAVRAFYEQQGWSKDYGLPGLSHRTGHGIGLDGHEPAYLVRNDDTPLAAGMCFSDEPGIYIPGEFGVRLEDCWYMSATGPKLFTPLAKSLEEPI